MAKVNNDGTVDGNLGVNDPLRGLLKFGKTVFMTDGSTAAADRIKLGEYSSVYNLLATLLYRGLTVDIRGTVDLVSLPLRAPFCQLPTFACTPGNDVEVPEYGTMIGLAPGSYGSLMVGNGATLNLDPNAEYTFCDVRIGRGASVQSTDRTTVNVAGVFKIGAGASFWTPPTVNDLPLVLNVGGPLVRLSQGAVVEAAITAPDAKIKIQRGGAIYGCFCADKLNTDKSILLECVDTTGP
jgi:hypothetical protein